MAHTFDSTAQAQPRTGRIPAPLEQDAPKLPHAPTPPWKYKVHPARWMYIEKTGEYLPQLGVMRMVPGTNGVDKRGDTSHAEVDAKRRGWTILPWDVLGDPSDPYVRIHDCIGGEYWCSKWETPRAVAGKPMRSEVDTEGYHEFLRELMRRGIVQPIRPEVVEMMCDVQRVRVESGMNRDIHNPHLAAKLDKEQAKLEAMAASVKPEVRTSKGRAPKAGK